MNALLRLATAPFDRVRRPRRASGAAMVLGAATLFAGSAGAACELGVYRHDARHQVVVWSSPMTPGVQRYSMLDGRRGAVSTDGDVLRCEGARVDVKDLDGRWQAWPHAAFVERPTRFKSHGTEFGGMLIEPEATGGIRPLVVFVHGSERTAAIGTPYPYLLAAQGMDVFVFDKRGTGSSGGDYTQDFELLGDDAVQASIEARRLAAGRYDRFGFAGFSQGGWVAPLAAKRSEADFAVVGFGLALTPLEEDQEQVLSELRRAGYDETTLSKARDVTAATGAVMASGFTRGFDGLDAVKQRYAGEPWMAKVEGEFTGGILRGDEPTLRRVGAALLDTPRVIWRYDAMGVLKSLDAPMLWVLAEDDREAPSELTRDRLLALHDAGQPVDVYSFPGTDHGIIEYVEAPDGTRKYTRVAEGFYRLLGDWILGHAQPPYGRGRPLASGAMLMLQMRPPRQASPGKPDRSSRKVQ